MLKQQSRVARHTINGLVSNARTLVPKYERLTGDVRLVSQVYRTTPRCGPRVRNRGRWRDGEAEVRARPLKMFGGKRLSIGLARLLNAGSERSLAPDIGRAASKMEKGGNPARPPFNLELDLAPSTRVTALRNQDDHRMPGISAS